MAASTTIEATIHAQFRLGESLDWKSHDPFDLLLSPYLRRLPSLSPLAARVAVQVGRRSGRGIRRLIAVPVHEEAKTLADYVRASVILSRLGARWAPAYVESLAARIMQSAVVTHDGCGWGLAFPYVSRFATADTKLPNVYVTTAASDALLDVHELTGARDALDASARGARFILDGLGSFERQGRRWIRYWPGADDPIVNVQASTAAFFARLARHVEDDAFVSAADSALETILRTQRRDGSWPYSDDGRGDFVDAFHTGFILHGLADYEARRGGDTAVAAHEARRKGFCYFTEHLLTQEGLPRAFANGRISLEGQNVAQCIQTLLSCGAAERSIETATQLWERVTRGVADRGSRLRFGAAFPALRWNEAPLALAGAHLLEAVTRRAGEVDG